MIKQFSPSNPFRTFYVVFSYIIVFSLWWGYLLYAKNETAFKEKIELNAEKYYKLNPGSDYTTTADYQQIHIKYARQRLMIFTEGGVFFVLLIVGFIIVRRVFKIEIELALQQRNFLHSITHELKSPLSTIKVSLQTMVKRKLEPEQTERLINNSLIDLDRLESLVDNILFAAKIEQSQHGFAEDEINIADLLRRVTDRFSNNKKQIKIQLHIADDVYLHLDTMGFISVTTNLIENAIKYSEPETVILVKLENQGDHVKLSVADNGIGIPVDERKKVFDKFYRIGNEDTRKTKGTGLGLFIVKRFMEIYKGTISIEDNKPNGTVFVLLFPKNNTATK